MYFTNQDNYTFTTGGFDITLNALGADSTGSNYTQCYTIAGAKLYVYINDDQEGVHILRRVMTGEEADGMPDTLLSNVYAREYDIKCYPTHFTTNAQVYVYAAIPRSESADQEAIIVYPSEKIDLYGRVDTTIDPDNPTTRQVGDPEYYYIDLGGIITSADLGERRWEKRIAQGAINGYIIGDAAAITRSVVQVTEQMVNEKIEKLEKYIESNLFFERYPLGEPYQEMTKDPETGELIPKTEHAKDADGNLLYYTTEEKTEKSTVETEWPVLTPVINENTAIRLKTKFLGLFTEGWLSAFGLNANGAGGAGGVGNIGDRLDDWSKYDTTKPQVLGANLGVDLRDKLLRFDSAVSASLADLNDRLSKIKVIVDFSELSGKASFDQLPALYWADQLITAAPTTESTPTVKSIKIGGATLTWDGQHNCLVSDMGFASLSFVSAYGVNGNSEGGGSGVASQTWGDESYTSSNAAPANLTKEKINDLLDRVGKLENKKVVTSWEDLTDKPTIPTKLTDLTGDNVTSFGGNTGAITVRGDQTTNGSVKLTMSNNELQASIVGLKALAFKESLGNADVGLGNVENIKLSTWAGSSYITTLGTITTGTWHGSKIANEYLQNNKMTLWGQEVALGGSTNGSITIKNGDKAVTLSVDASGYLKVDGGLYSTSFVSAFGLNGNSSSGTSFNRLDRWEDYTTARATDALSAKLGVDLYNTLNGTVATSLADLDARVSSHTKAFGTVAASLAELDARIKSFKGEILEFPITGSGNAVTNIVKNGTSVTVTKGATFLTEHQSLAAYAKTADLSVYFKKADFTKANIKTTLGISDWALAANKPTYTYDELSAKPTTAQIQALVGDYVTTFGGKKGAITVRGGQTDNGSVNLAMSNNELQASIVGLSTAAYHAHGDYVTGVGINSSGQLTWSKGGTAQTAIDIVAKKLATKCKLWGQYFDGTEDIIGNMSDVGNISFSASGKTIGSFLYFDTINNRLGVGTSNPSSSARMTVDGNLNVGNSSGKRIYFGDTSHYIELNSSGFHFSHGLYSDSFVSAFGANSGATTSIAFDTGNTNTNPMLSADSLGRLKLMGSLGGSSTLYLGDINGDTSKASYGQITLASGYNTSQIYGGSNMLNLFGFSGIDFRVFANAEVSIATITSSGLNIASGKSLKIGSTSLNENNLKKLINLVA